MNKIKKGEIGENQATKFLCEQGYEIIERNFRCKLGEIDIIARDNEVISFIEVKSGETSYYGHPAERVNYRKRKKLVKLAQYYAMRNRLNEVNYRFDVISVLREKNGHARIELIKDAFQLD